MLTDNVKKIFNMGEKNNMLKRLLIVGGFLVLSGLAFGCLYMMNSKSIDKVAKSAKKVKDKRTNKGYGC